MPKTLPRFLLGGALTMLAAMTPAQTQATNPRWSTYFGGFSLDDATVVRRGPGNLITIAGTTDSPGLATAGATQPTYAGNVDGFVARFDPSQPPGQQLVWFTYLGGNGMDLVFDLLVDNSGAVTVVGATTSTNFPTDPTSHQPLLNGPADAFFTRIDNTGSTRLYSTLYGGDSWDHITHLARLPNGTFALLGITDSTNLRGTVGTRFPGYLGGTSDAFVAILDPSLPGSLQLLRSTYLGGSDLDGFSLSTYLGPFSDWQGNLSQQALAVRGDRLLVATMSRSTNAYTTPGCYQGFNNGFADVYLIEIAQSLDLNSVAYATYFGGSSGDRPMAIAQHPDGGVVVAGLTFSSNLPTTANAFLTTYRGGTPQTGTTDAFVMHFDRGAAGGPLRYSSYFGTDGGEDIFTSMAVETSGLVTLAGTGFGGGLFPFDTTPGCHLPSAPPTDRCGAIVRLNLAANGAAGLVYSTLVAGTWTVFHGVVLDEVGDAIVAGRTYHPTYPIQLPHQAIDNGSGEVVMTRMPMLPGGAARLDVSLATPACAPGLYAGTLGSPVASNGNFALAATNAPPLGIGTVVFGFGPPTGGPLPLLNCNLLVNPAVISFTVSANNLGFAAYPLPVPAATPPGIKLHSQWLFLTNAACPGSGPLGTSERLVFTTL